MNLVDIVSLSRLPLRVHLAIRKKAVSVERVRFIQPTRPKAHLMLLVFCAISISLFSFHKFPKDANKERGEQRKSIFVPFPGTLKRKNRQPYCPSDPEWQAFKDLGGNPKHIREVCDDMARYITEGVNKKSTLTPYGPNRLVAYTVWFDFPYYKPPELERSGIVIADDHITWTTQPVNSLVVFRIQQALWPSAVARLLWKMLKDLIEQEKVIITEKFGLLSRPQFSAEIKSEARSDQEGKRSAILAFADACMAAMPRPVQNYCPRGSFMVSGLFQLESEKMWIFVDALFAWDYKTRHFVPLQRYRVIRFQLKSMATSRITYSRYIDPRK